MTRILKLLVILAGATFGAFALYDLFQFQARRGEIYRIIAAAHPLDRTSPQALQGLLRTENPDLAMSSSRELLYALFPAQFGDSLQRQAQWAAWSVLVRVHLSEGEQMAILCSRTFVVRRALGFQSAAQTVYSRNLDQLGERELATLVVIARHPSRYGRPDYDVDATATDGLLRQAHAIKDPAKSE